MNRVTTFTNKIKVLVLLMNLLVCTMMGPQLVKSSEAKVCAASYKTISIKSTYAKQRYVTLTKGKTTKVKIRITGLKSGQKVNWIISSKKYSYKKTTVVKATKKTNTYIWLKANKAGRSYITAAIGKRICRVRVTVNDNKPKVAAAPKKSYTQNDLYLLSHLINGEAGCSWISDTEQRAVGSVVLNRMKDSRFPNSMSGVIYQNGQYACTWDGNFNLTPSSRAIANAKYILENGSTLPRGVVFQSQAVLGPIYAKIGVHYFCY